MHMLRVSFVLLRVSSSAARSSFRTDAQSLGVRPTQRTRTPQALRSSRWARKTWREKPMMKRTSAGLRFQFSVEKA